MSENDGMEKNDAQHIGTATSNQSVAVNLMNEQGRKISVLTRPLTYAEFIAKQTARMMAVMEFRAKQGLFNGGCPRLGYDINYDKNCIVPNRAEVPVVKRIFDTYLKLESLNDTAIALNAKGYRTKYFISKAGLKRGGKKFDGKSIRRILSDAVYTGKVKYNAIIYDGVHKAIISSSLFATVQERLTIKSKQKTCGHQER